MDKEGSTNDDNPQTPPSSGDGKGNGVGLFDEKRHARADARNLERAIRRGWPFPEWVFEKIPEKLAGVVLASKSPRTIIAGSRALNAMLATTNAAAGTGETGPPINLNIHTGEPPAPIEGQGNITIPDNGRSIHADHS